MAICSNWTRLRFSGTDKLCGIARFPSSAPNAAAVPPFCWPCWYWRDAARRPRPSGPRRRWASLSCSPRARANTQAARIDLGYTKITAPITGRIGRSSVTQGALVTADQATALATIQQLDPIYVDITQSSTELLKLKLALQHGSLNDRGPDQARVTLQL